MWKKVQHIFLSLVRDVQFEMLHSDACEPMTKWCSLECLHSRPIIALCYPSLGWAFLVSSAQVISYSSLLGSLSDYLRVHELSTRELFNIISTMAKGLAFLHSDKNIYDPHRINKPAIAHRDFKSKNVLLKQDSNGLLSAVISDFGLGTVQKLKISS